LAATHAASDSVANGKAAWHGPGALYLRVPGRDVTAGTFAPGTRPADSTCQCDVQRSRISEAARNVTAGNTGAVSGMAQPAAGTFAVSSIPRAFMTARVVFKVGLPFSLNER